MTKQSTQATSRNHLHNLSVEFRRADLLSAVAQQLIRALNAELEGRYPEEGANFFRLDPDEVAEGRGGFFIAYLAGEPVGCGAVRRMGPDIVEIKRMYVAPSCPRPWRRPADAQRTRSRSPPTRRSRGCYSKPGPRQPEAIMLYERAGFARIPLYGEYIHTPHPDLSVCMGKDL